MMMRMRVGVMFQKNEKKKGAIKNKNKKLKRQAKGLIYPVDRMDDRKFHFKLVLRPLYGI